MFTRGKWIWLGCLLLAGTQQAMAGEIWAFRFNSSSPGIGVSWHDDLVFHNARGQDAVVRLVGISNGSIRSDDLLEIPVPAGRTISMTDQFGAWQPDTFSGYWVVRVEVPDGILVASRGGINSECPSPCGAPPNPFPTLGAFAMPVFRALVPAGESQFHIGADLGTEPSRFNVGLYNAGDQDATAVISVHQACDDSILESRTVVVAANAAIQVGRLGVVKTSCQSLQVLNTWLRYAVVVMDQPGLSYVFNLADELPFYPPLLFGLASAP